MPSFKVQINETRNYEVPVLAKDEKEAIEKALKKWRIAPTTGQWEVASAETEVVACTPVSQ